MNKTIYYPHLEIQVAEHCNLNCASCTHFSPLAEKEFINKDDFYDQLKKAEKIFHGHIKSLKIMGGEPLLHPEIAKLIVFARTAMPDADITVQTNGILLTKMSADFWQNCAENNVSIRITRYPVELDINKIKETADKYGADVKWHPADDSIKSFNIYPLNLNGDGDCEENFADCRMKMRYVLIKKGKLYPCPIAGNIEHFNKKFGTDLNSSAIDGLSIDEVKNFEEYELFASKAIPFCRYCKPTEYRRNVGWTISRQDISEWS